MVNAKIGVIGGAGVAATNKLCEMVEMALTRAGAKRDCDHPEMIVWQATHVPSRSMFYEGKGPSFIDDYVKIAKKLAALGAETLCMNCNTAHAAFEEIASQTDVRVINLIEETALAASQFANEKKFVLFASEGCIKSGVYQRVFSDKCPDIELIIPGKNIQEKITKGICNVKNACRFLPSDHPDSPVRIFSDLTTEMRQYGPIIMGCTDIRVAFAIPQGDGIDSLETLAGVLVRTAKSPEAGAPHSVLQNHAAKNTTRA